MPMNRESYKAGIAGLTIMFALSGAALAQDQGHGPDAWRVVGVTPSDTLNVRMGPGTDYAVIGEFSHDARGLRQVTCVPLVPAGLYFEMSEAERDALPQRWCLMQNADFSIRGWVAQRFLAEDGGPEPVAEMQDPALAAEQLVERLYNDHLRALSGDFTSPLHPARADAFFTAPLADRIARGRLGADPLFDAQDTDITGLRIALDTEQPMLRGLITVNANFRNFGAERRAVVRLRFEDGAPRIIRIEHEGWTFE
jgi:hypothetical protein